MNSADSTHDSLALRSTAQLYQDASERRRAQFLSIIIRTIAPLGVLIVLILHGLSQLRESNARNPELLLIAPVIVIVALFVDRLSRSKYHAQTALAAAIVSVVVILVASVMDDRPGEDAISLYYISFPILLSSVFLTSRATIIITALNLGAIIGVTLLFKSSDIEMIMTGPFAYVLIISVAIIIAAHFRNLIEQDNLSALSEQESRYRDLFETVFEGLIVCEGEKIIDVNQRLTRQLDYSPEELIGQGLTTIVPADAMNEIVALLTNVNGTSSEMALLRRGGTLRSMELVARPVLMGGRIVNLIATRDITDKKLAAQQSVQLARHQERVSTLEEIIDHVSHDFKTPLTTLNANIYLLRQLDGPPKKGKYIDALQNASERMERIVDQILTFSRLDLSLEKQLPETDIHAAIQDELARISSAVQANNLTLTHTFAKGRPKSRISTKNLHLVLANLLDNALQFSGECGTISLSTLIGEKHVTIAIHDTGIGIEAGDLERIFDNFYRVEKARPTTGGSGLGLAIVKRIVDAHFGLIEVESQPGNGSTFRVILPLSVSISATQPQAG